MQSFKHKPNPPMPKLTQSFKQETNKPNHTKLINLFYFLYFIFILFNDDVRQAGA